MVLKLYGFSPSTNTQRVVLVLNELKVPFEYVTVDLAKGEHKSEEYMKIQPFGYVPCIVCNVDSLLALRSKHIVKQFLG